MEADSLNTAVLGPDAERGTPAYNMFMAEHYALEEGSKIDGTYGIGNAAGRFWGGAFVTRNKFSIKLFTTPDGSTLVHFDKAMSGMSGGVIGVSKMKKEFRKGSRRSNC